MPSELFLYPLHAAVIGLIFPQSPKMGEDVTLSSRRSAKSSDEKPFQRAPLTVFGLGLHKAALGTLFGDKRGADEVGAALQLQAHFATKVRDEVGQAHDFDAGAVRFPFVSEGGEGQMRRVWREDGGEPARSSLGFQSLLLAVPAGVLQLLQLLEDAAGLVGGVDEHAEELQGRHSAKSARKARLGSMAVGRYVAREKQE